MDDYLDRACKVLGVDKGSVLAHGPSADDHYVVVMDYGIKGCPKYRVPLSHLDELKALEELEALEALPEPLLPAPAAFDLGLDDLNYRELQELARGAGIPAKQKADVLRKALWSDEEE